MPNYALISSIAEEAKAWRHQLHAHPELAFEEIKTAQLVAERLREWGLSVETEIAETGVVGVLSKGEGPTIGLRADMDALAIQEQTNLSYASKIDGKMHACGHDGHTAMLLGAAKYLASKGEYSGTVVFVFQPAEELRGGAKAMIDAGLFKRYPVDAIYGLHNWPSLEPGRIAVRAGAVMAANDEFHIDVQGRSCHAAMPHQGADPVVAASQIVLALQTIVSRNTDPSQAVALSVTTIRGGEAINVVPDTVTLSGCLRSCEEDARNLACSKLETIARQTAEAFGCSCDIRVIKGYPATVNSDAEAVIAADIARELPNALEPVTSYDPSMGSEDFAYYLLQRPGAYAWIGNGSAEDGKSLHNSHYDFNDSIIATGVTYWVNLVEYCLAAKASP